MYTPPVVNHRRWANALRTPERGAKLAPYTLGGIGELLEPYRSF